MQSKCGAKTRDGDPCQAWAMPNGRCRLHGGKSPGGIASATFRTGRHSKYLPSRLQERYNAALDDPDLLTLTAEVGLLDTRLAELLERVDSGESGRSWTELHGAWDAFQVAKAGGNVPRMKEAMAKLEFVFARSRDDCSIWDEVLNVLRVREKLVASERKRLIEMQALMGTSEALTFARALAESVKRHVHDPDALRAIAAELGDLIRGGNRTSAPTR